MASEQRLQSGYGRQRYSSDGILYARYVQDSHDIGSSVLIRSDKEVTEISAWKYSSRMSLVMRERCGRISRVEPEESGEYPGESLFIESNSIDLT